MLDIFINAVKLLTAKETRDTASALIERISRSPEWQKDICTIEARVPFINQEQAYFLSDLTIQKLKNLNYSADAMNAFKACFIELVNNAFSHSCKKDKDKVTLVIDITSTYVALSVLNPLRRQKFDFKEYLSHERDDSVLHNNMSERGRGLKLVVNIADELMSLKKGRGIKAVIYRDRVSFSIENFDDLTIIRILNANSMNNPSFSRRLFDDAKKHLYNNVVIDFSVFIEQSWEVEGRSARESFIMPDTRTLQRIVRLKKQQELKNQGLEKLSTDKGPGKAIIVLFDGYNRDDLAELLCLPREMVATGWKKALTMINQIDLLPHIDRLK